MDFPPYKNFVLARGEDYLAQTFKIWGADLSAYLTYCAFTNQFVNCSLAQIKYKNYLFFKENEIQIGLRKYFDIYFGEGYEDGLFSFSNFNLAYNNFRNRLFEEFTLKFQKKDKEDWETINQFNNPKFERQLLRFVAHTYYGRNYHNQSDYEARTEDKEYSRAEYFADGISCARGLNLEGISYNEEEKERVLAFQNLNYFREKLEQNITPHTIGEDSFRFLPVKPFINFISNDELPKFTQLTEYFRKNDLLIKNGVFEFMRKFDTLTLEKKVNSFYTIMPEDFFVMEQRAILPKINFEGSRRQVKPIQSVKELPVPSKTINLIEPQKYTSFVSEDYINSFAEEHYGSLENYYKMISEALKK